MTTSRRTYTEPPPLPEGGNAAHRAEWIRLEESLKYMECRNCHGEIAVTSNDTIHEYKWPGVRCGCGRDKAVPVRRERYVAKREREMQMAQEQRLAERGEGRGVMKYETVHGTVQVGVAGIQELVNPNVTDAEAWLFIRVCATHRVSPFADGEIHLIKHGQQAAYWVIGKQAYVNRGTGHSEYASHREGVITIDSGGNIHYREGEYIPRGEELEGGWCRVERRTQGQIYKAYGFNDWAKRHKFDDRNGKFKAGDLMAVWAENPPLMIVKTAVKQAFRAAFPDVFGTALGDDDEGTIEVAAATVTDETKSRLREEDLHAADSLYGTEEQPPAELAPPEDSPPDDMESSREGVEVEPVAAEPEAIPTPSNPKVGTASAFWSGVSKIDFDGKGNAPSNLDVSKALGADPIVYMREKDWGPENWDILLDEVVELLKKRE